MQAELAKFRLVGGGVEGGGRGRRSEMVCVYLIDAEHGQTIHSALDWCSLLSA